MYMNAICAFQSHTPLGIKDQFPGNPETEFVTGSFLFTFRVFFCNTIIQNCNICIEYFIVFVIIPAHKCITFCNTGINTDTSADLFTEISCWRCSTPVNSNPLCRRIHLQYYTILNLPPFCVYSYTANRHGRPCVWSCASGVQIPTFEDKTSLCRSRCIILLRVSYLRTLTYFFTFSNKTRCRYSSYYFIITIKIGTIKITDFILQSIIDLINMV